MQRTEDGMIQVERLAVTTVRPPGLHEGVPVRRGEMGGGGHLAPAVCLPLPQLPLSGFDVL